MCWRYLSVAVFVVLWLSSTFADAETIAAARYEMPTERYGHFALGRPHEYARLAVTSDSGRTFTLELPENEVFEDLVPRLVRLAASEPQEILAIVSRRDSGARLVLIRLEAGRLEISAQSPAIGTPMRWLNPVGVVDLDGDGRAEVAAVITPHIGGRLKVYRRQGKDLVEIAALGGFSNHAYGSPELALSAFMPLAGKMRLVVPDAARAQLRVVGLEGGRLIELGRCTLPGRVTGPVKVHSPTEISAAIGSSTRVLAVKDCAE